MRPVVFTRAAQREILEARAWYARRSVVAPLRFAEAIDDAIAKIVESPTRFPLGDFGTRRCLARPFPHLVIYLDLPDRVVVIAIAHGKKRPGYWRKRLRNLP